MLARLGHDVDDVRDSNLSAAPDALIAAEARRNRAVLITRDLDFADVRNYPPEEFAGILVLRLPEDAIAADISGVLQRFFSEPTFVAGLSGRLAIVEMDRVRFRPSLA